MSIETIISKNTVIKDQSEILDKDMQKEKAKKQTYQTFSRSHNQYKNFQVLCNKYSEIAYHMY